MAPKFTALGCHIYAGGFTRGVKDEGFKVLGHLEEWKFGTETSRANLKVPVWIGPETWPKRMGRVDWLYGNPPCAGWSNGNPLGVGREGYQDHTNRLFGLIDTYKPKVFTWESVAAAVRKGAGFLAGKTEFCIKRGYRVYVILLDGFKCGLPQHRKRMFFVASKVAIHFKRPNMDGHTVGRVIGGLQNPGLGSKGTASDIRTAKRTPKGQIAHLVDYWKGDQPYGEGKKAKGRPGFMNWRLGWDEPSRTVSGSPCLWHPEEPRPLTILEQKLICGYPEDYDFKGSMSSQYAQIGKAVLPPVARWLASQVKAALRRNEKAVPDQELVDFIHEEEE